jgi:23S rRNA (uracil1939-C5)-methyltransferase
MGSRLEHDSHGERGQRIDVDLVGTSVIHCPIARECGGCKLIGTDYPSQLALKTERVRAAIAGPPALAAVTVASCVPAPQIARYRNRAKLAVATDAGGVRIGLYASGTNRVVDLAPCRVERPILTSGVDILRRWLHEHGLARPAGPVIYVDLREADGGRCHLTLVVDARAARPPRLPYQALLRSFPALTGIALNYGAADSSYPLGEETVALHGAPTFLAPLETDSGERLAFEVPAAGFFQVATAALPEVHRRMRDHLGQRGTLYDLYCGVGVHGLMIERGRQPPATAMLVGIESSAVAVEAAERNAARFGVPARYLAARVEEVLHDELARDPAARIVMNPGRAGCRPPVLDALVEARPRRVAYLSCNPDTLARDLATLVDGGFSIVEISPIDLMPQTDHVEALALLAGER